MLVPTESTSVLCSTTLTQTRFTYGIVITATVLAMSDRPASSSSSSQAPPSTSKRKKPSDKDLDLNNANRGVWLVKVPKYISDRWESSTDGAELGQLRIARRAGQKPNVAFTLSEGVARAKAEEGKEANGGAKTKNGGGSQKQVNFLRL